jgi:hypothetical protein
MELPHLADIWTAAGVILGFQATSFLWRIANEVTRNRENNNQDVTWLPPADILNLIAMVVLVSGVFLAPLLVSLPPLWAQKAFGLSLLLFVGHCFALAGHYDMYNRHTKRSMSYFPFQERVVVGIVAIISVLYILCIFRTYCA